MGGKSVNNFQLDKCDDTNQHTGVDWLSGLPDDILIGILSMLPLKEAARTSILSSRWENLWKHTSHLNFDGHTALRRIVKNSKKLPLERRKYIKWVDKVIRLYKGFTLKELRIYFDLDKSSAQKSINRWLRFAFERRVERLELDLSEYGNYARWENVCALPTEMFQPHQPRSLFDSLKYLKALSFKCVDVTDQDVEVILRSCPLLENLVIGYATRISDLNICGVFALKHLEDEQVQKLVPALLCCMSQLEILTLDLALEKEFMDKYSECKFPELPKLKKLEIVFGGKGDESMIALTSLIRAALYIQELVIKIRWRYLLRTQRNIKNDKHSPHQHLKVVKYLGYYGRSSDVELVRYLVDNCVVLETLFIDPRFQPRSVYAPLDPDEIDGIVVDGVLTRRNLNRKNPSPVFPEDFDGLKAVQTSRKYAKQQLEGQIPQHIELVIL